MAVSNREFCRHPVYRPETIRKHPNGSALLRIGFTSGLEEAKGLFAYDTLGQEIFGSTRFIKISGERCSPLVTEFDEKVPIQIKSIKWIDNEEHLEFTTISYDQQGRPSRVVYSLSGKEGKMVETAGNEYHYDNNGRIKARVLYSFSTDRTKTLHLFHWYHYIPVAQDAQGEVIALEVTYSDARYHPNLGVGAAYGECINVNTRSVVARSFYNRQELLKGQQLSGVEDSGILCRVEYSYEADPGGYRQYFPEEIKVPVYVNWEDIKSFLGGSSLIEQLS
ncbi:MAG: hypothetical protein NZM26_00210 [Patescibacteria group bacterium]|nr:hypothetical protein [Patescibacteria group bacterium]